jgi:hypothetical protein
MLTKTRSVLTLSAVTSGHVQFAQWNEEDGGLLRLVQIEKDDWHELGEPHQVTLSIEPCDRLNEESQ